MLRLRLLWQISLPMLLVMVTAMAGTTWYATDTLRTFFLHRSGENLKVQAELIREQIEPLFYARNHDRLNGLCLRLGATSGSRVTVILPSGRVVADSMEAPARMDNHADRIEVIDGLAGRTGTALRYSHTTKYDMLYLAIPLLGAPPAASGQPPVAGVLRLSIPVTAIDQALNAVMAKIIACAILLVAIAALITITVSRKITQPLERMRDSAEQFAGGNLDKTITLGNELHISSEVADLALAMKRMAAQLNDRLRTVTEQRNELEAVLSGMAEAVLVVDGQERLVRMNRAASELLGVAAGTGKERPMVEILRNTELIRFVHRTLAARERMEDELILRDQGADNFFQVYGTLLSDAKGQSVGALIVLNDVTRLRRLEKMRRDFVANVSHELRTPITAIKGFIETLRDGAVSCPEDAERFLGIILKHADRLHAIVEDLLTLSRIENEGERGEIALKKGRLHGVLQNALETCAAQAQAKNITLSLDCAEGLSAELNDQLMEQAITNLVVNAIKYSHADSEVRVAAGTREEGVRITVQDFGIGIAREHLPRLFERFYRSDKARSRKLGGTGLGLAIVKHIVQAHGGTVHVESTPGRGTFFVIQLPG